MKGKIEIKGVKVMARHGVFDFERESEHPFVADATLYADLGADDKLEKTCDYGEAAKILTEVLSAPAVALIETLAVRAARALAMKFGCDADVTVHKPEAPIEAEFSDVCVTASAHFERVYLSLGSSMGEREKYLLSARKALEGRDDCRNFCFSSVYETVPYGGAAKNEFLNACVGFDTLLSPLELLHVCRDIEYTAGRERKMHWGDRTLDVDVILYGMKVVSLPELMVPHEYMCERGFVLAPLAEIAPFVVHPQLGKSMRKLYEELSKKLVAGGGVIKRRETWEKNA